MCTALFPPAVWRQITRVGFAPRYPFFLPVKVLSRVFRGKFVASLRRAFRRGELRFAGKLAALGKQQRFAAFLRTLFQKDWVVYAKPAFGGAPQVLRYLGRYTHRVAISNHRLLSFDGAQVSFRWKDYAHGSKQRKMTLSADEFLRRFLLHVLPRGLVRIRHFGFLANCHRALLLPLCQQRLAMAPLVRSSIATPSVRMSWSCPRCHGLMRVLHRLTATELRLRHADLCMFFDTS